MEDYREGIKDAIIRTINATVWDYYKIRETNIYGYDPVDQIIFEAATQLEPRHLRVFSLSYHGYSTEEIFERQSSRDGNNLNKRTIERYRTYAYNRIIEIVVGDSGFMGRIKRVVFGG